MSERENQYYISRPMDILVGVAVIIGVTLIFGMMFKSCETYNQINMEYAKQGYVWQGGGTWIKR